MRKNRVFFGLLAILTLSLFLSGCAGKQPVEQTSSKESEKTKVAFVYVGPVGDAGWSYAHEQGRLYLEQNLSDVITTKVESVPEGADAERVLSQLAEQGNKIIFATSYGYMDSVIKVAKNYPQVVFMHCSGYKTAENVGTYFGRMYQSRYLSGLVAGKMSKSNNIGIAGAYPIPEVVRLINATALGARAVNPQARIKVVWINAWYDPAREKEAANSLLEAGCDVIVQETDSAATMQAAEEKGKYGVGYNSDMSKMAPMAVLTSSTWNWGPYYVETVKAVREGRWKSTKEWLPMKEGIVGLAPFGPMVPGDVKTLVEEQKQRIFKGEWDVFTGPIKDQNGNVRVSDGQKMSDDEMWNFNWFVEGVDGVIPK
ncbi:MAG TPA: BMP family ABC transporter substrate-binding protein [Desulfobacterales bacterium]|nr:BMP family ABC transporter substrate-binding protein [Desulfobacterales bacterium]